jgi:hypothetical protein
MAMRSEMTYVSTSHTTQVSARAATMSTTADHRMRAAWSVVGGFECPKAIVGHAKPNRPGGRGGAS